METPDQSLFLGRIRTALGHAPQVARKAEQLFAKEPSEIEKNLLRGIGRRSAAERQLLLEKLIEAGPSIQLKVAAMADSAQASAAIVQLIAAKEPEWGGAKRVAAWHHPLIERLYLPQALDRLGIALHVTEPIPANADQRLDQRARQRQRSEIGASFIGVTSADFCLADTATLVMRNRPGQPRSVALVPSIHVAVIDLEQLLGDMKELFALLRWDERYRPQGLSNYMSFITGPSKTADIEATMVHGAHGPREVHLFVIAQPG